MKIEMNLSMKNLFRKRPTQLLYMSLRVIKKYIKEKIILGIKKIKGWLKIIDKESRNFIINKINYIGLKIDKFERWLLKMLDETIEIIEESIPEVVEVIEEIIE